MSGLITTAQLQPALIYLSENDETKVGVAAAKFLPAGVKLADYLAAIWAFAKQHNMGKPHFSSTRLAAALQASATTPAQAPVPALKAAAARVSRRAALEPVSTRAQPADLPRADSAPNIPRPWIGKRWRGDGYRQWRPALVILQQDPKSTLRAAAGGDINRGIALAQFLKNWLGVPPRTPAQYAAFIEYADAREQIKPPAVPAAKISPAAKEGGRNEHTLVTTGRPERAAPDGWLEIEAACGGRPHYSARYSGAAAKTQRLGFTKLASQALAERGFEVGKFVRVFWNPKARQLGLVLAGKGFKIRAGKDAFAIAGLGLRKVLGKDPIEFAEAPPADGYDMVFGVMGGAS